MLTTLVGVPGGALELECHPTSGSRNITPSSCYLQTGMLGVFHVHWISCCFSCSGKPSWCRCTSSSPSGAARGGVYAAIKFMIYTSIGSVLMLLGILTLYYQHYTQFPGAEFSIIARFDAHFRCRPVWSGGSSGHFFVGFAVKVPMFPFPYLAARRRIRRLPTAGSVVLARRAAEDGGRTDSCASPYRYLPQSAKNPTIINAMGILSIIGIVYGAPGVA